MATYNQYLRRRCIDAEWEKEKAKAQREDRKPVKGPAEEKGKALYRQKFGWIKTLDDVRKYNSNDWVGLKRMAAMSAGEKEGIYRSYGTHASGVLISGEDMEYSDWVPTMLVASSDTKVSQYDMHDVEEFGMLKGDWLGQKTLTVMKRCQELMGREDPADFSWIPFDDPKAYKALREGRKDNGIFHFEGYTKAKGGQELGIKTLKDVIMAQALYMPGAMESGQKDLYVKRHKSVSERKNIKYLHPVFETALKETYGAVIFQEQPLTVLRELGMDIASINAMFKVVKDSGKGAVERNRVRLEELREQFDRLALKAGIKEKELDHAWHLTTGFMNYGFNRAHATGYGIRAYRCAYLKVNHTLQFMTALLEVWAGDDKEKLYVIEARRMGCKVLPPDINISGPTWTMDKPNHAIRRGLSSIAGIGPAAAIDLATKAPFSSVDDLAARVLPRSVSGGKLWQNTGKFGGKFKALLDAGALDELPIHDRRKDKKPRRK
jgi:DNA polymerase-3 subunit alpha